MTKHCTTRCKNFKTVTILSMIRKYLNDAYTCAWSVMLPVEAFTNRHSVEYIEAHNRRCRKLYCRNIGRARRLMEEYIRRGDIGA